MKKTVPRGSALTTAKNKSDIIVNIEEEEGVLI